MKLPKAPKFQVIGFWLSMPFITFALLFIMFDKRLFHEWNLWVIGYVVIYFIGYTSWRLHSLYDFFLRKKYPSLEVTYKRVIFKLAVNLLIMTPSVLLIFFVFKWAHIGGYTIQKNDLQYGYLVGLAVNIIFESLWEVIYIIDKYKDAAAETQLIEQLQLEQEFDNLKQKVNPHFLFNCFNTLSSLISEDKVQAEKFLDELSKVYRYLLRNNESGMSTLDQEMQFIKSYYKLLKTRHGEAFGMTTEINAKYKDLFLPSLSLQLLVENAVKHNIVSKTQPVHVTISTTEQGYLKIENNLNKKIKTTESTGIGLKNISEKYRLLNRNDVLIEETAGQFIVTLPLIA